MGHYVAIWALQIFGNVWKNFGVNCSQRATPPVHAPVSEYDVHSSITWHLWPFTEFTVFIQVVLKIPVYIGCEQMALKLNSQYSCCCHLAYSQKSTMYCRVTRGLRLPYYILYLLLFNKLRHRYIIYLCLSLFSNSRYS